MTHVPNDEMSHPAALPSTRALPPAEMDTRKRRAPTKVEPGNKPGSCYQSAYVDSNFFSNFWQIFSKL